MSSEPMDHPPFDVKATGTAIYQSDMRKLPIDTLPTEHLERVIRFGATESRRCGPEIKWICEWRRVSRKWASVIDHCSALWSYIVIVNRTGHLPTQLAKSKVAPLSIQIRYPYTPQDEEWIRLLVDNVHRWKSVTFASHDHLGRFSAVLDSPPPMLEALKISFIDIPADFKFFNPSSPNLRVLELEELIIPSNIQPISGLEELRLNQILEDFGGGTYYPISVRKVHQFLQASPGLQVLELFGECSVSDASLQPVDLPNLEELEIHGPPVLHLFRAEHCADLTASLHPVEEKMPPGAWTTVVPTLRRAKGLEVVVSGETLSISSLVEPPTVQLTLHIELEEDDAGHLSYTILEDILQELENESCISARIQLSLPAYGDIGVKVLKLLQSPMPGPSSRWRLPHLDTVCIRKEGFPYQHLKAFVQARANAQGDQAPKAVTRIIQETLKFGYGIRNKEILGEVMAYARDEGVAEGAVAQAG